MAHKRAADYWQQRSANGQATRSDYRYPEDEYSEDQRGDAWEPLPDHEEEPPRTPAIPTYTATELLALELPEPRCVVSDVIPVGLSVLAGKPKVNKSWMALGISLAVAQGGVALGRIDVEPGSVLYIALEDTKRRLQDRLRKMLNAQSGRAAGLERLHWQTEWPRQDKGGLEEMCCWLDAHKDARLIVIDTWVRFRPPKMRGADPYEEDYEHGTAVKNIADQYGVACLPVHHCRKLDANDPLDSVRGSVGVTACADAVIVLKRERGKQDGTLFVTGRDIEEQEFAIQWDAQCWLWTIMGSAAECRVSRERQEIIDGLKRYPDGLLPTETAGLLDKPPNRIKWLMWRMEKDGQLAKDGGRYTVTNPTNPLTGAPNPKL
jgi:hypothetical protein